MKHPFKRMGAGSSSYVRTTPSNLLSLHMRTCIRTYVPVFGEIWCIQSCTYVLRYGADKPGIG